MKKFLLISFFFCIAFVGASQFKIGTDGDIEPFDLYPIVKIGNVQGSLHIESDRNDLPVYLRTGSIVFQTSDDTWHRWNGSAWVTISFSAGSTISYGNVDEIPFTNVTADGFDYSSNLKFVNNNTLEIAGTGSNTTTMTSGIHQITNGSGYDALRTSLSTQFNTGSLSSGAEIRVTEGTDGGSNPYLTNIFYTTATNAAVSNRPLWRITNGGSNIFQLGANGDWDFQGNNLTNVGTINGSAPGGGGTAGSYTPTVTGGLNYDASTTFSCNYLQVGTVVMITGQINVDATAAGTTTFELSLPPIASDFTDTDDVSGTVTGVADQVSTVIAVPANDRPLFNYVSPGSGITTLYFSYSYIVK